MATSGYDVYNLKNILNAAGSFRFCEGAHLTRSQAMLAGWRDVGHVVATDISPSVTTTDHRYCRLGRVGTDRKTVSDAKLEFGIKCEEMTPFNLQLALMGEAAPALTQAALASDTSIDPLAFSPAAPSGDASTWYNLTQDGAQRRELTFCKLTVAPRSATADPTTDRLTLTAHGFAADTPVVIAGTSLPEGVTGDRIYRVQPVDADRFQLRSSSGGPLIDFTSAGSELTVRQVLTDLLTATELGVAIDSKLGAVRFLYPVTQTVTVTIQCPAIDTLHHPESLLQGVVPLRTLSRTGYCRLLFYADDAPNKLVGDYVFRGQIVTKGASELDGTKAAQFDFTVTVLDDPGTFYVAP